jgi:hypothetical protein
VSWEEGFDRERFSVLNVNGWAVRMVDHASTALVSSAESSGVELIRLIEQREDLLLSIWDCLTHCFGRDTSELPGRCYLIVEEIEQLLGLENEHEGGKAHVWGKR